MLVVAAALVCGAGLVLLIPKAVDRAEDEGPKALAVNATGPGNLARLCAQRGVKLLHVSTDYVFDGEAARPYREDDPPNPVSLYGRSKLEGERAVQAAGAHAVIMRTQALFGVGGRNFVEAIAGRLERGGGALRVVNDQFTCPTYVGHLADAMLALMASGRAGVVHVSASGSCSWYEFACAIAAALAPGREAVQPVPAAEYPVKARRPPCAVLDKTRYRTWTGRCMPTWQEGLAAYLAETGRA